MSMETVARRTTDDALTQQESELVRAMLAHQVGIDPDRVGPVLDLAAVGVVNNAWRNSPVEDWHAGDGPLGDGDMLRINSHTCWRVRQTIRRWRREVGLAADADAGRLDDGSVDDWDGLAVRIWRWLVNPQRLMPSGFRLVEIAGDDLADFSDHVAGVVGGRAAATEERGGRHAAWSVAAHGGLACRHWWGTPTGPAWSTTSSPSLTSRRISTGGQRPAASPTAARTRAGGGPRRFAQNASARAVGSPAAGSPVGCCGGYRPPAAGYPAIAHQRRHQHVHEPRRLRTGSTPSSRAVRPAAVFPGLVRGQGLSVLSSG
ncbi:hypothetical protein GA0070621_2753 [Micromonospora narathiwatensis]|uniref:Uncharacterized protein n=1 Tax=Micromonospora narathiwatensis TaxID=299146 RepID=A0A1A8ZSR1_9ACTN|nr:hypothetical protein GA0070621_2753 [Micromonospora narathiwatensis]